ncbi:sulfate adenylyltransferase subunit CysN [Leeuwenhoekiella blandensis]|uniref:sulfate adenylyltransferase subunit CysN n=2 Tax=Leeuwenhoekiella blandensis TaxID=360293 RepID=UPI002351FD0B|nr:sulfate adenylyltransferase subunit CysN [Leeuwenhoekiella blandensis]|tara:strand:- start:853 stop:2118 length:1266 start_codon:yes stop_codon:yes gene_type:complete
MEGLQHEEKEILRFTTAGSVDDGKSTLIGRLLFDSKSIYEDQIDNLQKISEKKGISHLELAHLTDGLKDEREQGITIDVAYRYFATPKRKFIIADTPGHVQYTRNMITGASTANLALILVDARKGVIEQTKRHSFIASLLQIQHVVVCVNKMDLEDYSEARFNEIVDEYKSFASKLKIKDVRFIPISALNGDNVVDKSEQMPWFSGDSLLGTLENIHISSDHNMVDCRFPVQNVIRPFSDEFHDYRGYAGRVISGIFKKGDEVMVLPSGFKSKIQSIVLGEEELEEAFPPQSVTINLEDDIDISRGDMIVREHNQPEPKQDIEAMLCWMNNDSMSPRAKYAIKHTSVEARAMIKEVLYKVDINTLHRQEEYGTVGMNDIIRVKMRTTKPLLVDEYNQNKGTGSFILIDESTNETVAAGMVI